MTLLPHHARELIEGSGIDPTIVARRGYRSVTAGEAAALGFADYQARPGLLMPQWTLAGVQVGYLLKPDTPRIKSDGKLQKYEAPEGSVPHFDIHPEARHLLNDTSVPLCFTEGNKKSDAHWSRGELCVSLTGVWMFLHGRLVVPDLDEIALEDRRVRIVFDSDVTRKPEVAEALLRFAELLHRRGARVEVVYLPEPDDGGKTGLDDFYVAGGTVADLDALAVPWDGKGPGLRLRGVDAEEADRRYIVAEADRRALIRAINVLPLTELRAAVSTGTLVLGKLSRGDVDENGDVVLSAADISHDHRPKPEPKQPLAPTNADGTAPRMPRSSIKPLLTEAAKVGAIRARPIPVDRKHATSGAAWRDTAWAFSPVSSLAELLNPWIAARADIPKTRKRRTVSSPCPKCGEIHAIKQLEYCTGCGEERGNRIIEPETGEILSPVTPPPSPAPVLVGRKSISGLPEEPVWLADAPPVEWRDKSSPVSPEEPPRRIPTPIHAHLAAASRTDAPEAKQALYADLTAVARERGRTPVPKPLPNMPAECQPDPWAEAWP